MFSQFILSTNRKISKRLTESKRVQTRIRTRILLDEGWFGEGRTLFLSFFDDIYIEHASVTIITVFLSFKSFYVKYKKFVCHEVLCALKPDKYESHCCRSRLFS